MGVVPENSDSYFRQFIDRHCRFPKPLGDSSFILAELLGYATVNGRLAPFSESSDGNP